MWYFPKYGVKKKNRVAQKYYAHKRKFQRRKRQVNFSAVIFTPKFHKIKILESLNKSFPKLAFVNTEEFYKIVKYSSEDFDT